MSSLREPSNSRRSSLDTAISDVSTSHPSPVMSEMSLEDIRAALELEKRNLKIVKSWVWKKSSKLLFGWQKRFIYVYNFKVYYSKSEIFCSQNAIESLTGIRTLLLADVTSVVQDNLSFKLAVHDVDTAHSKVYKFKCESKEECDVLFSGIKSHWDFLQKLQD